MADTSGTAHPTAQGEARQIQVDVWRGGTSGALQRFAVAERANQTVLDVVSQIQRQQDPGLAYRFACRVGMCGSCAMTVNGRPRWTCRTHVSRVLKGDRLELRPLRGLPVIRDLVTDMTPFFEKWRAARGRFSPGDPDAKEAAKVLPDTRARRAASAAIECINCAVCQAACDVAAWRPDYLGPAALNRAWAAYNDERDGDRAGILGAVSGDAGCHSCHTHHSCTEHCPVALDPSASIAGLKRATLRALIGGGRS